MNKFCECWEANLRHLGADAQLLTAVLSTSINIRYSVIHYLWERALFSVPWLRIIYFASKRLTHWSSSVWAQRLWARKTADDIYLNLFIIRPCLFFVWWGQLKLVWKGCCQSRDSFFTRLKIEGSTLLNLKDESIFQKLSSCSQYNWGPCLPPVRIPKKESQPPQAF